MKEMTHQFKILDKHLLSLESRIGAVESKISTVLWVIGAMGAAITVVISILALRL